MLHSVILAGGSGTRLWPESRQSNAKQFLAIESEQTMIEATVARLKPIVPNDRMWILTTESMANQIETLLPEIPKSHIVKEPVPRNTAPCIGLAAARINKEFPNATMIVLPSDHIIRNENSFCQTLQFAADLVAENPERLITLGVKPTFPSTSYGYIERNEPITSNVTKKWETLTTAYNVNRFHEKPPQEKAVNFVQSGRFAWNAGIFVWNSATIINLIAKFEPEIGIILNQIADKFGTNDEKKLTDELFPQCKNISIDYAVLEHADSIVMLEAAFDWDDVGTWCALDRIHAGKHDEQNNLALSTKLITINSSGCIVRADNPEHLFALLGINDVIIVQSNNATLIAKKEQEESVRNIINELKKRNWNDFL
ncbi:MAG: NTP transferase domain-containing protein [Planctomycetaceae bacterium]|jgi:mannose-1-phosphate guanylyltransferase|nr:NTP transferase domain-containing protein [Planctomycetaceae bacterium]